MKRVNLGGKFDHCHVSCCVYIEQNAPPCGTILAGELGRELGRDSHQSGKAKSSPNGCQCCAKCTDFRMKKNLRNIWLMDGIYSPHTDTHIKVYENSPLFLEIERIVPYTSGCSFAPGIFIRPKHWYLFGEKQREEKKQILK